ncbi:MAG TPA: ABC transporter substrate-binding protein [Vicinamibacterales bacterium]
MTGQARNKAASVALLAVCAIAAGCNAASKAAPDPNTPRADRPAGIARGGSLVVSTRSEPATFNRIRKRDTTTELLGMFTGAKLVRINRATQELEPALAESWTRSDDGLTYTLKLRPGVEFSDGEPFTSADVLFTFDALYDPKAGCELADAVRLDGKDLKVSAPDASTVVIRFPVPFAPGVRILDNVPMQPKHKLEAALRAGTFSTAWDLKTPLADIVGLGPFVPSEYVPGQRLIFTRNPHYFRKAPDGGPLPYLDRVTMEVVPDQDAQMLRLDAGQIDALDSNMRPEDYAPLKRAADGGRIKLLDLGMSYDADSLWFNLRPGAYAKDPRAAWLQRDELRHAISLAVDRKAFADTVFLGAGVPAYGPETPANAKWFSAQTPHSDYDPDRAKTMLASIGLKDRNGDGILEDDHGNPVRFTLLTQKGKTQLERGASVVRDDLKRIGVVVDVVAVDFKTLVERFLSGANYDAIYFSVARTDTDPAINPDFWFSSGSAHFWNIGQKTPATAWEKEIDDLMAKQIASTDERRRKQLFDDIQRVFAEHEPVVYFAAPRVFVAMSSRVSNATPALLRPQLLWAADTLAVAAAR